MNKLFLVSFVAIVAACPAFADVTINANASTAQCDNTTLGTYTGPANLNSVWIPAISGAISLDGNRYAANDSGSAASTATTAVSPATVYSLYGTGVYSTQPTTSNWASYTAANRLSALTTSPQMTGYTFDGFYTTKASGGTQLIDSSGNFKYNTASSQISTDNDTATWYAHWTPINYTISFAKNTIDGNGNTLVAQNGTAVTPTGTMADQTYAYDSTANLRSNAYSITGYEFEFWDSTVNPGFVSGGSGGSFADGSAITYRYPGNVTLVARWGAVPSGAITLNSNVYPGNDRTQNALYTTSTGVTAPTTTTVYSQYNTNLYTDSNLSTTVVYDNLVPSKTGYTFNGFYNSAGTTQYIEDDGSVQPAGTRAVTTSGGTDIWYANWTPINYKITFAENTVDTNGNTLYGTITGTMSQQTYAYDSTANLRSNAYSITGYNFDGWSTTTNPANVNGGNATLTNAQSVTYTYPGNATLTAQWSPVKSGAITLNTDVYPNNDTSQTPLYTTSTSEAVTPPTTTTVYSIYNTGLYSDSAGTTAVVAANLIPSKAGYAFMGFKNAAQTLEYISYYDSVNVNDYALHAITTENGTDTWYAYWLPTQYIITYKPGTAGSRTVSGSNVNDVAVYDYDDSTLATLAGNTFSITGYSFAGWSSDYNVTTGAHTTTLYAANTAISPYKVPDDIEMTATWTPNCYGPIILDSKRYVASQSGHGQIQTYDGVDPTSAASPSSIYTLYDNGIYTDNACTSTTGLTNGKITIPTLTGYSFTGFYTKMAAAVDNNSSHRTIDSTGALTSLGQTVQSGPFYAGWTPKSVSLGYSCGKTAPSVTGLTIGLSERGQPPARTTATYDDSKTLASSAGTCALTGDRGGFHFGGWSCTPNPETGSGTATYTSTYSSNHGWNVSKTVNPWRATNDVTCEVIWTGNDYTISYDHGTAGSRTSGFSGTMSGQSVTFGDSVTLTANAFSIPGYTFKRWTGDYDNDTANHTSTVYTNGRQFTYILPNNLSLTAQWTPINYTITYNCGSGSGNEPTTNTSATYDAQFTPATNTCTPPAGHSFTGWLVSGTQTTVNSAFTWEYTENKTLTAQYTANNITLSWNPDGGTAQDGTAYAPGTGTNQCTYGGDITMPAIPKKNGYHLLGWDLIQNPGK